MREHCLSVRKSLADFVLENAVLRGSFKLSSGKTSNYYIDGKKVLYNPYGLQLVVKAMRQMLYSEDIDAIGGPETGAIPIAAAFAIDSLRYRFPVSAFTVRKKAKTHGTQEQVEGLLERGSRVVVVDDVGTTGGALIQAIEVVG